MIGGGLPIGILAGKAKFMDALDGGALELWRRVRSPKSPVTFFAGTFVRHPLVLAGVRAVLLHLKAQGPALQAQIAERAADLAQRLNEIFARHGLQAKSGALFELPLFQPTCGWAARRPACSITFAIAAFTFRTGSPCS